MTMMSRDRRQKKTIQAQHRYAYWNVLSLLKEMVCACARAIACTMLIQWRAYTHINTDDHYLQCIWVRDLFQRLHTQSHVCSTSVVENSSSCLLFELFSLAKCSNLFLTSKKNYSMLLFRLANENPYLCEWFDFNLSFGLTVTPTKQANS